MRGSKKVLHKVSAGGLVFKEEEGKRVWLLIRPKGTKRWTFPKGEVGDKVPGEKKEEAAVREVREESGVEATIVVPEPLSLEYWYREGEVLVHKKVFYFIMRYVKGEPRPDNIETDRAGFFSEKEVSQKLAFKDERELFSKAIALLSL